MAFNVFFLLYFGLRVSLPHPRSPYLTTLADCTLACVSRDMMAEQKGDMQHKRIHKHTSHLHDSAGFSHLSEEPNEDGLQLNGPMRAFVVIVCITVSVSFFSC